MEKVLLLGATGRLGREILNELIKGGFAVNVIIRDAGKIEQVYSHLEIFEGDPANSQDLAKALSGCAYLVSALNISRKSDFPWAKLRTPGTFLSDTLGKVLALADQNSLKQIVICSAWGVGDSRKEIPWWFAWMIDNSNIGSAYLDHERQEKLLLDSGWPFTIFRPVGLTNGAGKGEILWTQVGEIKPKLTIDRKAVAKAMVSSLGKKELMFETYTISKK